MPDQKEILTFVRGGRFAQALGMIENSPTSINSIDISVLHAHLLERTGSYRQSRQLCERFLRSQSLSLLQRSICETTLGVIKHDTSDAEGGTTHFQKAVALARSAKDLPQTCWSQLRLMVALADRLGPPSAVGVLAQVRADTLKLGDPQISAALHIFTGEMEARRGLSQNARRHTTLGMRLLNEQPNLWLEARAENTLVALAIMRSDVPDGIAHGTRALKLATESGSAGLLRACRANLGNLCYLLGNFEEAIDYFKCADTALLSNGNGSSATLESIARTRIRQGQFDQARDCLDRIRGAATTSADSFLHANRYAELTRLELLERSGLMAEALEATNFVAELAARTGDHLLRALVMLRRAYLLTRAGRQKESNVLLAEVARDLPGHAPDLYAQYEKVVACALAMAGDVRLGLSHASRACRVYRAVSNKPGLLDLEQAWNDASTQSVMSASHGIVDTTTYASVGTVVQDIAALMMHIGRPELLATGLVSIFSESGAVVSVSARSRAEDGTIEMLASFGEPAAARQTDAAAERTIVVGSVRDRTFEVVLTPRAEIDSLATVNAVLLLLDHVRDLERAHVEREERLTLWPVEEVPVEDDQAVLGGEMLKLMASVRKMAAINVIVLITGESGTGKEILARAIHRYSPRAGKPFVPFNSAAIPREMLESQLFGHRRGAFTGADRDSPGLIRAARDGTLFLDEIGEMSLDLQPKLLRFLESGEINPLGEPSPLNVDVRIIAATNSNLEQMVQDGRFREDLFYRLNVCRLLIPPLRERRDEIPALVHHFVARAAAEFRKGRLRIAEETMEHLVLFPWPGNVRQLQNELQRMVALADEDAVLAPSSLSAPILRPMPKTPPQPPGAPELAAPPPGKLMPAIARVEREMIRAALTSHQGRIEAAAKSLGISRKGLYLKRQRLGL